MIPTRSSPSKSEKPIRMNITVPIQKSIRFFIMIFPAFFALVKPVSTMANPACIQNTNAAPIKNQTPKVCELMASIISCVITLSSFNYILKACTFREFPAKTCTPLCIYFFLFSLFDTVKHLSVGRIWPDVGWDHNFQVVDHLAQTAHITKDDLAVVFSNLKCICGFVYLVYICLQLV